MNVDTACGCVYETAFRFCRLPTDVISCGLAMRTPFIAISGRLSSETQALQDPWWVLPVEVMHGLTFAAMWAATTDFAHGVAPGADMKQTAAAVGTWVLGCRAEASNLFAREISGRLRSTSREGKCFASKAIRYAPFSMTPDSHGTIPCVSFTAAAAVFDIFPPFRPFPPPTRR